MKSLELLHLCRRLSAIHCSRGIRTDAVLLMKMRRNVPRSIPNEPGIRRRRRALQDDEADEIEHEDELDGEVDFMNKSESMYDENMREKARRKFRLEQIITSKKFFSPRPQPLMLTCNERECIRYLHKQDPVQWDVKTLSESFPARPDVIQKILKGKWKITPERAKILDSKAQKNWELLAEGKLDADPDVLEHLKKFVNRREVLLEQIKNADFYLPEVKTERVWNNGEFSGVLNRYEKAVQKLIEEKEMEQQPKRLGDGTETVEKTKKSSLDLIHSKVNEAAARLDEEDRDSFVFGEMTKFYSAHTTLENLEEKILKRADANKKLDLLEKAILERKLNVSEQQDVENMQDTNSSTRERNEEKMMVERIKIESKHSGGTDVNDEPMMIRTTRSGRHKFKKKEILTSEFVPPDERTILSNETKVGEVLCNLQNQSNPDVNSETENKTKKTKKQKNVEGKPEIDYSDPERLHRESVYFDNEVKHIEHTAFWNARRSSKEKALAESNKTPHEGPLGVSEGYNPANTAVLSQDAYPERIKIPKSKHKSGLTYKVKDCFYDDDGEFLYRVPGMSK